MSFMRTIWVAVRAINYTDQATKQVGDNITKLEKQQQALRTEAVKMVMAGVMWVTFAALATMAISNIMKKSAEGSRAIAQFERSMNGMLVTLGASFTTMLAPAMKIMTQFFDLVAKNPALANLIAILSVLLITFIALKGMMMIASGAMTMFGITTQLETIIVGLAEKGHYGLATSLSVVHQCLGPVLIGFTLMFTICQRLPPVISIVIGVVLALAAAIILLRTAMGDMTWMAGIAVAGAAAGAIAAGVWNMTQPQQTYQTGIYSVRKTGPAIVHEGEEIRSKRNVMYGQETEKQRPETRYFNITFSGDIHTKADKEGLKPLILKTVREAMDNKA